MTEPDKLRLGGMALRNGLLVHGPTHWAAAVRTDAGEIKVGSGKKPRLQAVDGVPGVRGVVRLGEAMAVIPLVKRGLPEVRLPFQDVSVLAVAAGASLTGALARKRLRGIGGESIAALASVAPALFALRGGELAEYHGVEHKAIAAYEQGAEDARDTSKEHERCGSHLVAPLLASNLAGHAAAAPDAREAGPDGGRRGGARVDRGGGRGVRVVRAQQRDEARAGAAPAGLRDPAADRHARARRAPARGRAGRARGDPAGRSRLQLRSTPHCGGA